MSQRYPGWTRRGGRFVVAAAGCLVAALVGASPGAVTAQSVVGVVSEAGSGHPVAGALVRLEGADGRPGPYALTAKDGRYRIMALRPGRFSLLVERIGYAGTTAGPVELRETETVVLDVAVSTAPLELEGIEVTGETRRCALVAEAATSIQALWDEARKALAAAVWTEEQGALRFRLRSREATLDPRSLAVRDQESRTRTEWGANTVRSLSVHDLQAGGYVRTEQDGSMVFYAPDARALLSDEFLATHCIDLVAPDDSASTVVGLRFRPVPGRGITDVVGTVWIHATSGRLDRIDFSYSGLPQWPGIEHAGGAIRFSELPDGRWIVRDWYIRAPVVGVVRTSGRSGRVQRMMATALAERGTEALTASGPGVEWRADQATGAITGVVFDSTRHGPLAGAEVRVAGRAWRTRANAGGVFSIRGIPPGRYRVEFAHPRVDSLGAGGTWQDVEVHGEADTEVYLAVPSRETLLALDCAHEEGGVVVGWVTSSGTPVPGASVIALDVPAGDGRALEGVTNREGGYRLCGLPSATAVALAARLGPVTSSTVHATPLQDGYVRADLNLDLRGDVAGFGTSGEGRPTLTGTVVDGGTGRLLPDVLVELVDAEEKVSGRTLTDAAGRFVLRPAAAAAYTVRAGTLGYAPVTSSPLLLVRGSRQVEVRMAPEAIAVAGIVVTVEARSPVLERSGFYDRRAFSGGQFLDREAIEAAVPLRTTDVLRRVPGVQSVSFPSEAANTTVRRIQLRGAMRFTSDPRCLPGVYVDGVLVRPPLIPKGDDDLAAYLQEDDLVSPHDIEAIEVYDTPAVTPVRFQAPGPACGVLVIWTRQGRQ